MSKSPPPGGQPRLGTGFSNPPARRAFPRWFLRIGAPQPRTPRLPVIKRRGRSHERRRERRGRTRCATRAAPDDDGGGDHGDPTVSELLDRLGVLIDRDLVASTLLRRWSS